MGERPFGGLLKIAKDDLDILVDALAKSPCVILAPIKEGEATKFAVMDGGQISIPRLVTRPVKELFLPGDEAIFSFDDGRKGDPRIRMPEAFVTDGIPLRAAIGVRPCDARALVLLDHVFASNNYVDPYYVMRRQQTVIITFACSWPKISCFCTSTGSGPYDETGSDVMLMESADSYLINVITERGKRLLRKAVLLLEESSSERRRIRKADDADIGVAREVRIAGEQWVNSKVPVEAAVATLAQAKAFTSFAWEEIHRKCLGCAVCTYLCPTCHCFGIGDEVVNDRGVRVRNWDSCMFPLFTLHASGHNPRPSAKERFRQRVMHKFNYFVENNNCVGCVGCGRCVENCPVNLDVRQVLSVFAKGVFA